MAGAKIPFNVCESDIWDNEPGLSWDEIKYCGDEASEEIDPIQMIIDNVLKLPTWSDFDSADLNGDGVILFEEWKTWAKGSVE